MHDILAREILVPRSSCDHVPDNLNVSAHTSSPESSRAADTFRRRTRELRMLTGFDGHLRAEWPVGRRCGCRRMCCTRQTRQR